MVLKKLEELSASELRTELKRVGIKGKFIKAQAIMRLTTHLIDISEDPMTFEFDPEMVIDEVNEDNPEDYVVTNDGGDTITDVARSEAASVRGLTNAILNGPPSTSFTPPSTATPFVSTSSASITTSTVTTSSGVASNNHGYFLPSSGVGSSVYPNFFNPHSVPQIPGMAGMSFPNQYQVPNPYLPPVSGAPPAASPWPMYSPYGGAWAPTGPAGTPLMWTPPGMAATIPVPIRAFAAPSPSVPTVLNSAMADFTGACPPPARNTDTKSTKIVSGQYDSGRREVKERQNWPQVMIDHILNPETVDYDSLDWAGLTAGMTGKILAEMDPAVTDMAIINKIKHVNRLANYGMKTPMKSILNFNAVLFRAIENRGLSWDNWDKIEQFHTRHLSSLTVAAATGSVAKPDAGEAQTDHTIKASKRVENEALRKAMTAQHICFRFNRGKCDHEDDHDSNGNGLTLLHACGLCSKENRGIVKTHGAQECKPDFWPPLFRSQHNTGRGGGVQTS